MLPGSLVVRDINAAESLDSFDGLVARALLDVEDGATILERRRRRPNQSRPSNPRPNQQQQRPSSGIRADLAVPQWEGLLVLPSKPARIL